MEGEREKHRHEGEMSIGCLSFIDTPTGDRTHNLGTCPNLESNPKLSGLQNDAPAN